MVIFIIFKVASEKQTNEGVASECLVTECHMDPVPKAIQCPVSLSGPLSQTSLKCSVLAGRMALSQPYGLCVKSKGSFIYPTLKIEESKVPLLFSFVAICLKYCHFINFKKTTNKYSVWVQK